MALSEEIARRWMGARCSDLDAIAGDRDIPPDERLTLWMQERISIGRRAWREDPCLFASFAALGEVESAVVQEHIATMIEAMQGVLLDGIATGAFASLDVVRTARALDAATARFHHPALAATWDAPDARRTAEDLIDLLVSGLRPSEA